MLAVGIATNMPFSGNNGKSAAHVKGDVLAPGESPRGRYSYGVDGDYFEALGFALREGRFLTAADSRRAERVCVVDEDFARQYWPQGGAWASAFSRAREGPDAEAFTIVGVVGRVKQAGLTEAEAQGRGLLSLRLPPGRRHLRRARTSLAAGIARARHCKTSCARSIPTCRSPTFARWDARIDDSLRRAPLARAAGRRLLRHRPAADCYWDLWRAELREWRSAAARSASAWRWARGRGRSARSSSRLALRLLAAGLTLGLVRGVAGGPRDAGGLLFDVPAAPRGELAAAAGVIGLVSFVACLLPSHRAARISPMEALSDQ